MGAEDPAPASPNPGAFVWEEGLGSSSLYDDMYFALAYNVARILPSSYPRSWEAARACLDQTVASPRIKRPFTATAA